MAIDWTAVTDAITSAEASGGLVGVAITAPNGEHFAHRGDRPFRAASTVKIPLMVEIFRQIDAGKRTLNDLITLLEGDKAPGSGVLLHLHSGIEVTLYDLLYLMISISDNTATNMLIDFAGMESVNATIRSLGMTGSNLGRKMMGRPAQSNEQENWGTANDYNRAIQAILKNEAASADSCAQMRALLELQQNGRRIARHLPAGIRWGSKTGSIAGVTNDVGFIEANDQQLLISVFCEALPDQHHGEAAIGNISRAAMLATGHVTPSPL